MLKYLQLHQFLMRQSVVHAYFIEAFSTHSLKTLKKYIHFQRTFNEYFKIICHKFSFF